MEGVEEALEAIHDSFTATEDELRRPTQRREPLIRPSPATPCLSDVERATS